MFRDRYKEEMDRVLPSEEVRRRINSRLIAPAPRPGRNRTALWWRAGTAVAACIALLLSVMLLPHGQMQPAVGDDTEPPASDLMHAVSYDDIYRVIQPLCVDYGGVGGRWNIFNWFDKKSSANVIEDATGGPESYDAAIGATTPTDAAGEDEGTDYTVTNTQVEGVDEADIVKTDGRYIYSLSGNTVRIVRAGAGRPTLVNAVTVRDEGKDCHDMYLAGDRLIVMLSDYSDYRVQKTQAVMIDVTDPANAKQLSVCEQSGGYNTSRMIGNHLYVVSSHYINTERVDPDLPESFVPSVTCRNETAPVAADSVHVYNTGALDAVYTVACAYDVTDGSMTASQSVLGDAGAVYCSTKNLLTASYRGADTESGVSYSVVTRFSIDGGEIAYQTDNRVQGSLLNQFSMDEHNGYFRFVTTVDSYQTGESKDGLSVSFSSGSSASLYVLDDTLQTVGKIERLAEGERVYSVRFMGDTAYFVTFRQTDPLFSADLSDPAAPRIIGQLKIPGFSEYLFPFGDGQLLGVGMDADENTGFTTCVKLSMFDISDPSDVTEYDKVGITDVHYSYALSDHRAALVDPQRGVIGLCCFGERRSDYRLYSFEDGFREIARLQVTDADDYNVRGLFIGDVFYLVSERSLHAYSTEEFIPMGVLIF